MSEEDHLENLLKIIAHDDYDEEVMRLILIYVRSRNLLDTGHDLVPHQIEEINEFLSKQPPVELLTRRKKLRP